MGKSKKGDPGDPETTTSTTPKHKTKSKPPKHKKSSSLAAATSTTSTTTSKKKKTAPIIASLAGPTSAPTPHITMAELRHLEQQQNKGDAVSRGGKPKDIVATTTTTQLQTDPDDELEWDEQLLRNTALNSLSGLDQDQITPEKIEEKIAILKNREMQAVSVSKFHRVAEVLKSRRATKEETGE
ncbi:hypothetical protein Pelo_8857 [Pelomyxa schiedti]|nr:hypothetical protein Pelo_8857 [Pelomyxa schiedti]